MYNDYKYDRDIEYFMTILDDVHKTYMVVHSLSSKSSVVDTVLPSNPKDFGRAIRCKYSKNNTYIFVGSDYYKRCANKHISPKYNLNQLPDAHFTDSVIVIKVLPERKVVKIADIRRHDDMLMIFKLQSYCEDTGKVKKDSIYTYRHYSDDENSYCSQFHKDLVIYMSGFNNYIVSLHLKHIKLFLQSLQHALFKGVNSPKFRQIANIYCQEERLIEKLLRIYLAETPEELQIDAIIEGYNKRLKLLEDANFIDNLYSLAASEFLEIRCFSTKKKINNITFVMDNGDRHEFSGETILATFFNANSDSIKSIIKGDTEFSRDKIYKIESIHAKAIPEIRTIKVRSWRIESWRSIGCLNRCNDWQIGDIIIDASSFSSWIVYAESDVKNGKGVILFNAKGEFSEVNSRIEYMMIPLAEHSSIAFKKAFPNLSAYIRLNLIALDEYRCNKVWYTAADLEEQ